ncbi:MAG TPA: SCP2 sterol-binding domain-containing protein [Burkholderiaceae bacterium]|nr:SCP2 sterol-binding domain-containing protein [Burkholderiaceae bacterium]
MIPSAINHLLAQEPWARAKLAVHNGKTACFDLSVLRVSLTITADGMLSMAAEGDTPQVTIRVKPEQLPLILQNRERAFSYVTVEGDADFANTISQVSQALHWEAEEDLSRLVGDIAATRMVAGARAAFQTVKTTRQALAENVAEYLLEEKPVLVRPQAVQDFGADVARMRDDVERLQKRIEKLEGRIQ